MIKCETLGMFENAHVNPVVKLEADVENYSFCTVDGVTYLIANTVDGDSSDEVTFKAGELLNGWDLGHWVGQQLVIDEKHISGEASEATVGSAITIDNAYLGTGGLGNYQLICTSKSALLTEPAVKARIAVAASDEAADGE